MSQMTHELWFPSYISSFWNMPFGLNAILLMLHSDDSSHSFIHSLIHSFLHKVGRREAIKESWQEPVRPD